MTPSPVAEEVHYPDGRVSLASDDEIADSASLGLRWANLPALLRADRLRLVRHPDLDRRGGLLHADRRDRRKRLDRRDPAFGGYPSMTTAGWWGSRRP
jgi:hypothetical protein